MADSSDSSDDEMGGLTGGAVAAEAAQIIKALEEDAAIMMRVKRMQIPIVDHSAIVYPPFRKDFFKLPNEYKGMSKADFAARRFDFGRTRVSGRDVPPLIDNWAAMGFSREVHEVLKRSNFAAPMPIQGPSHPMHHVWKGCYWYCRNWVG